MNTPNTSANLGGYDDVVLAADMVVLVVVVIALGCHLLVIVVVLLLWGRKKKKSEIAENNLSLPNPDNGSCKQSSIIYNSDMLKVALLSSVFVISKCNEERKIVNFLVLIIPLVLVLASNYVTYVIPLHLNDGTPGACT